MKYAAQTKVTVEKSKAEIEHTLVRYGASQYLSGWDGDTAYVVFRMNERMYKFQLEMPMKKDFEMTPAGKYQRSQDDMLKAWEQACRQRWRSVALIVKAKLEAIELGYSNFEQEFLANLMLPDGTTVGEAITPKIEEAYRTGGMPELLPWTEWPRKGD